MDKGEQSYKHLDIEARKAIERGLNEGRSLSYTARVIDVDVSTVRREILRNRRCEYASRSKGADRTDCAHLKACKRKSICDKYCEKRLCKRCQMRLCQDICPDYELRVCMTTEHSPFTCNSCEHFGRCTLMRYKYSAELADGAAKRRATESRNGVDLTKEELDKMVITVIDGLELGQSVHHIFETNDMPVTERTFYRYVEEGAIDIISLDLPKKVKYKKRKSAKKKSHESGFYAGHEYEDWLALDEEDRAITTEVDTVWGKKQDKKCILSLHRIDLHFQLYLLLQARTEEQVVQALDWLEECSEGRFSEFFGC